MNFIGGDFMSELRAEAIYLIENVPENYLSDIVKYIKNFISDEKITSEKALQTFYNLRAEAEKNNLQNMTLDEINEEINAARQELK